MGYYTEFSGQFKLNKVLTDEQFDYLNTFMTNRHMKRDPQILHKLYGGKFGKFGTDDYGPEGEFFAKPDKPKDPNESSEDLFRGMGQEHDESILDYNEPPGQMEIGLENFNQKYRENQKHIEALKCVPSLWCPWQLTDIETISGPEEESKAYEYISWIKYLIDRFFKPLGISINGTVHWAGEDRDDRGKITIVNNSVSIQKGRIVYR